MNANFLILLVRGNNKTRAPRISEGDSSSFSVIYIRGSMATRRYGMLRAACV